MLATLRPTPLILVGRDDVPRVLVAQELRVGGADRKRRVEVRVLTGGQRIVDEDQVPACVPEVAEVTDSCARGRHRVDKHLPALFLETGVVREKERPALDDRTADGGAVLVAIERRLRVDDEVAVHLHFANEEVARVEGVVAHVLERGAVEGVRPRLGRDRNDAGATAELGGENAGEDLELADLLDRRRDDDGVERILVIVDAVDEPAVGVRLVPEGVEVRRAARVECARAREVFAGLTGRDARCQVDQRREVPAVERQLLDRPFLDDGADFRRVGPDDRRLGHDGGRFLNPADFERHVDAGPLVDLQDDALTDRFFEALDIDFDRVGPWHQKRRRIVTGLVGDVGGGRPFVHFADRDGRAGDDAAGVAHRSDNGPGRDLGGNRRAAVGGNHSGENQREEPCLRHYSSSLQSSEADSSRPEREIWVRAGDCHRPDLKSSFRCWFMVQGSWFRVQGH